MSRDFTPRDLVIADKMIMDKKGESLFSATRNLVFIDDKGHEIAYFSDEEKAVFDKFPWLARLLDGFTRAYVSEFREVTDIDTKLIPIERSLEKLVYETRNNVTAESVPTEISEWYFGKLDKGFYYNDENNRLFFKFLRENVYKDTREAFENVLYSFLKNGTKFDVATEEAMNIVNYDEGYETCIACDVFGGYTVYRKNFAETALEPIYDGQLPEKTVDLWRAERRAERNNDYDR